MLNISEQFDAEYDVLFNSQKKNLVLSGTGSRYEDMPLLRLNGEWLKAQPTATHLGHTNDNNNIKNIVVCIATRYIVWRTNYVLSKFGFCN